MINGVQIITEVKTHSPFGWKSDKSWEELFEVAERVGDIISIHTDPRWHGSFELLERAHAMTKKPILAKGIHASDDLIEKALEAGADWVLVVGRIPTIHSEKCLIEPLTLEELKYVPANLKAVWNSRDLATGGMKNETFKEAREVFPGWLCQASNIKTVGDIESGADAVLVGTRLGEFVDSIQPL
jgi:indole-3-glycerol phosphate synthase